MKEYGAAMPRHGRIGIVANLDQPSIGEVVMPHFLLLEPGWRLGRIVNGNEPVVIGTLHIVDPRVCGGDLMKWIIRAVGQVGVVSVNSADPKNASGRAPIALLFSQTGLVLPA